MALALGAGVVVLASCARDPMAVAEPEDDAVHAAVVAHANRITDEALDVSSRALPSMNAHAEPETDDGRAAAADQGARDDRLDETADKALQPEGAAGSSKAKTAAPVDAERPPTGPRGERPPLSAAEAAERSERRGGPADGPTPTTPPRRDVTPEAMSPTAPAETASPSR